MRVESSVTSISWIPSDAIPGLPEIPFELGIGRYDEPPPDRLEEGDLERLRADDRFREANRLSAWIEVEDGKIVDCGQEGGAFVGASRFALGPAVWTVPGVAFDVLRPEPRVRGNSVRFVQTVGGRAGFPTPRRVRGRPYFRLEAPVSWTTLALTLHVDGSSEHRLVGASAFPRHWIYDSEGKVVAKSGTIDFSTWYRDEHGENTPWGNEDSDAFVTAAESALERELSRELMAIGADLERRELEHDETLVRQGEPGRELFLVLDGVLAVEVDGREIAELGPGAIVGELASLDGGKRTATLWARTPCRLVVIPPELVDRQELEDLAATRRS